MLKTISKRSIQVFDVCTLRTLVYFISNQLHAIKKITTIIFSLQPFYVLETLIQFILFKRSCYRSVAEHSKSNLFCFAQINYCIISCIDRIDRQSH